MPLRFETGITGRGFDVIIIDDPDLGPPRQVRQGAEQTSTRTSTHMIASRLDDQIRGVMIVVGQRMHEDDLSGNLLQKGGWKHVCSAPGGRGSRVLCTFGNSTLAPKGLANRCWSKRWQPEAIIKRKREEVGASIFAAQYQQNPTAAFGRTDPSRARFKHFDRSCRRTPGEITLSWDTAVKTGSG
jgi:hypothetical protein